MSRDPYRNARQEHLADALEDLAQRGLLSWRWEYDARRSRAVYHVTTPGEPERELYTRSAESKVEGMYTALGVPWLPVPHPGGEIERRGTLAQMNALQSEGSN